MESLFDVPRALRKRNLDPNRFVICSVITYHLPITRLLTRYSSLIALPLSLALTPSALLFASSGYGIPLDHQEVFKLLKQHMENAVNGSAYNWVRPSLWSAVFGAHQAAGSTDKAVAIGGGI